ncbi:ATP-binding protein [Paenibacillus sp.]|uniref:HAMP domain-containing sensor histidine kinase n=1 Tax=Paenibacillus sp. TaxID=58172 RepID=UPI00283AA7A9|nr:ATP-binding protein [Paenibacillus sp.]
MSAAMQAIKEGDLGVRVPGYTKDELGMLARDLNQMVAHLQESIVREQQAESMKNSIITNISHDLRTPLTSMMGYMELAQAHLRQNIDACERYVSISQRKGLELKQQIDELLEYCHLTFSGIKLNLETIAVKPLIQQVLIDFVPQLEEAGMSLDLKDQTGGGIYTEADVRLLIRLLQNVINNGIFYGRKGGKLTIRMDKTDTDAMIHIINYGDPIAKEDLPFIFERLYRGDKSRSTNGGGKGMGLAIAKSIVELHHGSIIVASDARETSFTCILPLYEGATRLCEL